MLSLQFGGQRLFTTRSNGMLGARGRRDMGICGRLGHFYLLHSNKCNIIYLYMTSDTILYIYILVSLCTGTVQVWIYIYIYCNFLLQQHANRPSAWVHHLQPSPLFFWVKTILSPYRWKEDGGAPFMMGISWEYSGIWGFIGDMMGIYRGFILDFYGI